LIGLDFGNPIDVQKIDRITDIIHSSDKLETSKESCKLCVHQADEGLGLEFLTFG